MNELKVTIEAPALVDALNAIARAIEGTTASVSSKKGKTSTAPAAAPVANTMPVAAAPVQPAPVQPAPVAQIPAQTAPVTVAPVPAQPTAAVPTFTLEMLANAGAELLERGLMAPLMALLNKYGVQAVTMLQPNQFPAFADELRALGANI